MATVDTCWGPRKVHDNAFWHLVPATGGNAKMFYNNVRVGKGALFSVSAGIEAEPGIEQAQTPYSITRIYDEKERIFEEVRITRFPTRPSRLKTLYVFDDFQFVERAQSAWYSDEPKVAHKCHLLVGSVTYRADTFWLNSHQNKWEDYAERYWSGEMSEDPFPEVLVHGAIYFLKWKTFPKGYV